MKWTSITCKQQQNIIFVSSDTKKISERDKIIRQNRTSRRRNGRKGKEMFNYFIFYTLCFFSALASQQTFFFYSTSSCSAFSIYTVAQSQWSCCSFPLLFCSFQFFFHHLFVHLFPSNVSFFSLLYFLNLFFPLCRFYIYIFSTLRLFLVVVVVVAAATIFYFLFAGAVCECGVLPLRFHSSCSFVLLYGELPVSFNAGCWWCYLNVCKRQISLSVFYATWIHSIFRDISYEKNFFFSVFLLVVVYCLACPLNEQRYNVNHTPSHTQSKSIALSFVLLALCHFITTITGVARSTLCAPSHTQIHSHFLYEFFAFTFFFVRCESIIGKKIKYDLPFHCFSFLVLYFSFSILRHAAASFYSSKIVCSSRKWFSVVRMKISSANDGM